MANTPIVAKANTGTGTDQFASDLLSGVNWPYSKIAFGASGTATAVSASDPLPVDIGTPTVSLSAGSLSALENITVGGTVEIGATSLAALESITVGGTVDLGSTSLAALENVTVGGTVELGATSLAALETITVGLDSASLNALETVTVGGTVELGATSLAALESITATGPLTDAQLRATPVPVSLPNMTGLTFSQAGVITINTDLLVIDCQGFEGISIQCVSMGTTGVVTPAWSNDNTTYVNATILTQAGVTATTFNAAGIWTTPVLGRYLRLRLTTATTAGTTTLAVQGMTQAANYPVAAQPVSGSVTVSGTVTANQGTILTPTASFVNSAATTNGTVLKASAGTVYGVVASNTNAAARFLKFHNSTTVTPGTTAVALTVPIPANSVVSLNFGQLGMRFGTGICLSITGAAADNDTTAILAGEVKVASSFV